MANPPLDADSAALLPDHGADPLVILPGLLCDAHLFTDQTDTFNATVIDGFYGGATSIEAMAEYALARMPARSALLGHSMGARVAIQIMATAPERVSRLALASTGVHQPGPGEANKRYGLRDFGRDNGAGALVDRWLPPMIGPVRRADAAFVRRMWQMAVDAGLSVYEAQIEALLHRPNAAAVLPGIACPTAVIVGADDAWSPVAQHETIAGAIARAELHVVPGAGHMLPAEDPTAFNAIIRDWLIRPAGPTHPGRGPW